MARLQKSEDGASLIGLVVSVVLLLILGGGAIYGYGQLDSNKPSGTLAQSSKLSVDSSVVSSTLRMDLSGASSIQNRAGSDGINIARSDGSCVSWKFTRNSSGTVDLSRASALNAPTSDRDLSVVASGAASGNLSLAQNEVNLAMYYSNGQAIDEQVPYTKTSQGGGSCW